LAACAPPAQWGRQNRRSPGGGSKVGTAPGSTARGRRPFPRAGRRPWLREHLHRHLTRTRQIPLLLNGDINCCWNHLALLRGGEGQPDLGLALAGFGGDSHGAPKTPASLSEPHRCPHYDWLRTWLIPEELHFDDRPAVRPAHGLQKGGKRRV